MEKSQLFREKLNSSGNDPKLGGRVTGKSPVDFLSLSSLMVIYYLSSLGIGMCESRAHDVGPTEHKSDGTLVHLLL